MGVVVSHSGEVRRSITRRGLISRGLSVRRVMQNTHYVSARSYGICFESDN